MKTTRGILFEALPSNQTSEGPNSNWPSKETEEIKSNTKCEPPKEGEVAVKVLEKRRTGKQRLVQKTRPVCPYLRGKNDRRKKAVTRVRMEAINSSAENSEKKLGQERRARR